MKFQMLTDWPVNGPGISVVPAGTVIDGNDPQFNGTRLSMPMPLTVRCLDQESYDAMVAWYAPTNDQFLHLLQYAPGVQPKKGTANG